MIEHLSGSSMNAYDNDIHSFYTRYVLGEEPVYCENVIKAMEFGKEYEDNLFEKIDDKDKAYWIGQEKVEMVIGGYKMVGLFDFVSHKGKVVMECKTKSGWWSEKDIHSSWQFRFYNEWCRLNGYEFRIHQFNKKLGETKEDKINREDKTFEQDFINKAQEIERFLKQFNIELKKYDI